MNSNAHNSTRESGDRHVCAPLRVAALEPVPVFLKPSAGRGDPFQSTFRIPHSAFTLTEVLISIAIMGVGLTMAAALFPSAIKENEKSFNSSTGTLIAQNGLAIAKAVLQESTVTWDPINPSDLVRIADESTLGTALISLEDQHYPMGTINTSLGPDEKMRGFVLLGRQIETTGTQLLIAVSYSRFQNDAVAVHRVPAPPASPSVVIGDDPNDMSQSLLSGIPGDELRFFQRGGLVITSEGRFARIVGAQGAQVVVTPQLPTKTNETLWTIVEVRRLAPDPANWSTWPLRERSPAMSVMVTRTALRD